MTKVDPNSNNTSSYFSCPSCTSWFNWIVTQLSHVSNKLFAAINKVKTAVCGCCWPTQEASNKQLLKEKKIEEVDSVELPLLEELIELKEVEPTTEEQEKERKEKEADEMQKRIRANFREMQDKKPESQDDTFFIIDVLDQEPVTPQSVKLINETISDDFFDKAEKKLSKEPTIEELEKEKKPKGTALDGPTPEELEKAKQEEELKLKLENERKEKEAAELKLKLENERREKERKEKEADEMQKKIQANYRELQNKPKPQIDKFFIHDISDPVTPLSAKPINAAFSYDFLDKEQKELMKTALIEGLEKEKRQKGKALDDGDCLYDAFAQGLARLGIHKTVKELRQSIHNYVFKLDQGSDKNNWVKSSCSKDAYNELLEKILITAKEGTPRWGDSLIDGPILCELYKVQLRIWQSQYNEFNTISLSSIDLGDENYKQVIEICNAQGSLHFDPVFPL